MKLDRSIRTLPRSILLLDVVGKVEREALARRRVTAAAVARAAALLDATVRPIPQLEAELDSWWDELQAAEVVIADMRGGNDTAFLVGVAVAHRKKVVMLVDARRLPFSALMQNVAVAVVPQEAPPDDLEALLTVHIERALDEVMAEVRIVEEAPINRGVVITATVHEVAENEAVVVADDGRRAALPATDVSWTRRVRDMRRLLRPGQVVKGLLTEIDGVGSFSMLAARRNPWPSLARRYPLDEEFEGRVVSLVPNVGVFVAMTEEINGLIPRSRIPVGADLEVGDRVVARPVRIDPALREVELRYSTRVVRTEQSELPRAAVGDTIEGVVSHVSPDRDYVLIDLAAGFTAMMHVADMSEWMRALVAQDDVAEGDRLRLQVIHVDALNNRYAVTDIDDADPRSSWEQGARTSPEELALAEHELLDRWAAIEPYVLAARRVPAALWPKESAMVLARAQLESVDRWYNLFRQEIDGLRRVRNEMVHRLGPVPIEVLDQAIDDAERLGALLHAQFGRIPTASRHVIPSSEGWAVRRPGSARDSFWSRSKQEAIHRATEIIGGHGGGTLTIHDVDGSVSGTETFAADPAFGGRG